MLDNRGLSWREYAESMPAPCWAEISGEYYPKHNPFVYYAGVSSDMSYCASHVVPLGDVSSETGPFFDDLRRNELPSYSFITPNICDDAHDCPLSTGDAWLKSFIQKIVNNDSVFQKSIIFICFDEGTTNAGFGRNVAGGQIYGAVIGPSNIVRLGSISSVYYSHYSILGTVEKIFDLGSLGRNDKTANTIGSDIFTF